jgi:hypothetical protein
MPEIGRLQREEAFAVIRQVLRQRIECEFGGSLTTRLVVGCVDLSGRKDVYKAMLLTELDDKYEGEVYDRDAQSGLLDYDQDESGSDDETFDIEVSTSVLWDQVRAETASVQSRLEALHKLLTSDRDEALAFLATEIGRQDAPEDWIVALVFLVEDVHFAPEHRSSVRDSLFRIALAFRKSAKAGAERVVWAAVRRAASFLTRDEAIRLVPFLESDAIVDARAVALKCIEKLFATAPPEDPKLVEPIGKRAHTLAQKFLDKDIFAGGEYALLAQSAVCALAAIGDERLGELVSMAKALNKRWLKHQLRTRLETIRSAWASHGNGIATLPAYRNLETELMKLS